MALVAGLMLGVGERTRPVDRATIARAEASGAVVEELLARCRRTLEWWQARADRRTGLLPDFLPEHDLGAVKGRSLVGPAYSPADSGADHHAHHTIAAWLAAPELYTRRMPALLEAERLYAELPGGLLAEWVDLRTGERGPPSIFATSEYAKDGLLSVVGLLGDSPWSERLDAVTRAIVARADTPSDLGPLPGTGAEIHGDLLLVLVPLVWRTGDPALAALARRIADAWVHEVLPMNHGLPSQRWDFTTHRGDGATHLRDHGNEIIAGLVLHTALLMDTDPEAARATHLPAMRAMVDRVLAAANEDGLLPNRIDSATLAPFPGDARGARLADSWGYVYGAAYNLYLMTGDEAYRAATRRVMRSLPRYVDHAWSTHPGHDDYADTIEGAIYLLAHEDVPGARAFVDALMVKLLSFQGSDGRVGASYLDGNWLRTTLLYTLMQTRGATVRPWGPGVRLGVEATDDGLVVVVTTADGAPWSGTLRFDAPRHRTIFRMPRRYVRLNEWPEWTTLEPDRRYLLCSIDERGDEPGPRVEHSGAELARGIPITTPTRLVVRPLDR